MKFFDRKYDPTRFEILDKARSRFNEIYVIQNGSRREMFFKGEGNFYLQSSFDLRRMESLILVYSRMMLASLLFRPAPRRILMIGLGGGSIADWLHQRFPEGHLDVVEVDEKVVEFCGKYFFLNETGNFKVHVGDGRVFVQNQRGKDPYDLVLLDAFKSGSIPFHLKTSEFYEEIREILSPGGVVASNLYGKSNPLKPKDRNTFAHVFPQVYCFQDPEAVATVLVAVDQDKPWPGSDLRKAAGAQQSSLPFSPADLEAMFQPGMFKDEALGMFRDEFSGKDFMRVVKANNTRSGGDSTYPIKSHN